MSRFKHIWHLALAGLFLLSSCKEEQSVTPTPVTPTDTVSLHLTLGNPSGANSALFSPTNYFMEKEQFVLSYNRDKGIPNWVSWHLSSSWIGSAPRQDDFRPDNTLPEGWYQVRPTDFTGSGFDRGHLCPSADRTASIEENSATFLMTNMMPQAPDNNRITWENLESYSRRLVGEGNELYIIAGPLGSGGSGSNGGITYTLAEGKVTVPASTWKVIVVLPAGDDDINRITANTRVIAVNMPNTQSVNDHSWDYYRLSVDELESLTGYDFLSRVSPTIQSILETQVDDETIQ